MVNCLSLVEIDSNDFDPIFDIESWQEIRHPRVISNISRPNQLYGMVFSSITHYLVVWKLSWNLNLDQMHSTRHIITHPWFKGTYSVSCGHILIKISITGAVLPKLLSIENHEAHEASSDQLSNNESVRHCSSGYCHILTTMTGVYLFMNDDW